MMLWISPLLALIALVSVPVSTLITVLVARQSQAHFAEQWCSTGELNAQLEEFFTGHEVVKAFGRQEAVGGELPGAATTSSPEPAPAPSICPAVVQPLMVFVANLNYVAVAVVGALQVTAGAMTIGGIQAFIQFSRLFSQPMGQIGGMLTLMQSCLASAERVFALLDAPEIPAEQPAAVAGPGQRRKPGRGPDRLRARHLQLHPGSTRGPATSPSPWSRGRPWRSWATPVPAKPPW